MNQTPEPELGLAQPASSIRGRAALAALPDSLVALPYNEVTRVPAQSQPDPAVQKLRGLKWRLYEAWTYRDGFHSITIPAGFEFDLASIPRVFWWLIAPFELSIAAPLVHDALYQFGGALPGGWMSDPRLYSRLETDRLFRRIMEEEEVPAWRRDAAYRAVRIFGHGGWKEPQ